MKTYKIIADSGSTKTDWVIIDEDCKTIEVIKTIGFNPYFQTSEFIYEELLKSFSKLSIDLNHISHVYYYGSGCSSDEKRGVVVNALKPHFLNAEINVFHDLIAAARATLGNSDGIACILGTGANSCIWEDGKEIANIASHGYIFGDEGSGSYLGIELVKLFLGDHMSEELKNKFETTFKLSKDQILNTTYREKNPNVFLASFAKFYLPNIQHQELRDIIYRGFKNFFEVRIIPYKDYEKYALGFVGSISYFYKDILQEVAEEYGAKIKNITRCPIDELTHFHSKQESVNI